MTREHVFPQWVKKVLEGNTHWQPNLSYTRGTVGGPEIHVKGDILETTVRIVCGDCNGGWMSEIEAKALPYVAPMIKGEQIRLDRDAQNAIATWAALKAVVARYSHSPPLPTIEDEWMEWFRSKRTIPKSWQVWLSAYRGKWYGAAYEGFNVHDRYSMMPPWWTTDRQKLQEFLHSAKYKGLLASFIFGHLAIKVFGVRRLRVTNVKQGSFVKVAPSKRRIYWPPRVAFDESTALELFDTGLRAGTSGIVGKRST